MAPELPHGSSSQSAYPLGSEELYPPHHFTHPPQIHAQTSNEASYDSAVSYNEAPYHPPVYFAPQATRANSDRKQPGSAAQARPAINTPLPTYGTNSHFSPPRAQLPPTPHSHTPPGYITINSFDGPQHLEEAPHHPPPGISGGHLGVGPHVQLSPPVSPTIGPRPQPLDVESPRNSGQRRDSGRFSEHSPTSPSTSFLNLSVPNTRSTTLDDSSTDNSHAPKESAVAKTSFPRGRTQPQVQPVDWSRFSRHWRREKPRAPQLVHGQSVTSPGSNPPILSSLGEGQRMDIDTFCTIYSLPETIPELFRAHAITATHAFSHLTETNLAQMGFKIGEIIDLKEAIKTWASSRESL